MAVEAIWLSASKTPTLLRNSPAYSRVVRGSSDIGGRDARPAGEVPPPLPSPAEPGEGVGMTLVA